MKLFELAEKVLDEVGHSLTIREIWNLAEEKGYQDRLNTNEDTKNPLTSLSTEVLDHGVKKGIFVRDNNRPAKISLASWSHK